MALEAPFAAALHGSMAPPMVNICPPPNQNNQDPKTDNFRVWALYVVVTLIRRQLLG